MPPWVFSFLYYHEKGGGARGRDRRNAMRTGNPVRRGGGRGYPGGEAFRCPEANLLPVTKFVGNGLLIKCLGQVDLPNAPLEHRPLDIPALPHAAPDSPGIGWPLGCGKENIQSLSCL